MGIEQQIHNAHLITDVYGYGPSFHDAEVLRVTLDRTVDDVEPWYEGRSAVWGPCLDALIYISEMSQDTDSTGSFTFEKHRRVLLHFRGVTDLNLTGFNEPNALFELSIKEVPDPQPEDIRFEVGFSASYGLSASFQCYSIGVESVVPCEPMSGSIKA